MKKFLLPLFAALALTIGAAAAQTQTPTQAAATRRANGRLQQMASPEEQAARQTERLTKELGLSSDQSARVQQILLARGQEKQALYSQRKAQGQNLDKAARQQMGEQMKASRAKYDAQLKEVLTADQYTKYTALQQERGGKGHGQAHGKYEGRKDGKMKAKPGKVKIKTKED